MKYLNKSFSVGGYSKSDDKNKSQWITTKDKELKEKYNGNKRRHSIRKSNS